MATDNMTTKKKALAINLDPLIYGTFAEIGAGQEVARNFFRAGKASQTVAKTMSAYDMTFSDAIYGKEASGRYVCQARLKKMLSHEFDLLQERLGETRSPESRFFSFAATIAGSVAGNNSSGHGWLGVRFQITPKSKPCDFIIHVRMLDDRRLNQQEALGIVGVNMIHSVFAYLDNPRKIVPSLVENLERNQVEIDMIGFDRTDNESTDNSSPSPIQHINNRILSLDLLHRGITQAVMFSNTGQVQQPSDELFRRPIFVQRGTFRPVTNSNIDIQSHGLSTFLQDLSQDSELPLVAMEMTLQGLSNSKDSEEIDHSDFLERVEIINALGHNVLISNCFRFFTLKTFLRKHTDKLIGMVIGAAHLEKLFDESFYKDLDGGILQAMGRLFDQNTKLYVYPHKVNGTCLTTKNFTPPKHLEKFYQFLLERKDIVDISDFDGLDVSIHSADVRTLLAQKDDRWEQMVPAKVKEIIHEKKLFGYSK